MSDEQNQIVNSVYGLNSPNDLVRVSDPELKKRYDTLAYLSCVRPDLWESGYIFTELGLSPGEHLLNLENQQIAKFGEGYPKLSNGDLADLKSLMTWLNVIVAYSSRSAVYYFLNYDLNIGFSIGASSTLAVTPDHVWDTNYTRYPTATDGKPLWWTWGGQTFVPPSKP